MRAVERFPNGNTLVANGYLKKVIEVTPAFQVLWTLTDDNYLFTADRYLPADEAFAGKSLV